MWVVIDGIVLNSGGAGEEKGLVGRDLVEDDFLDARFAGLGEAH